MKKKRVPFEKDFATTDKTICPYCRKITDACLSEKGGRPTPGSISICAYCARSAMFEEGLTLRKFTDEETQNKEIHRMLCKYVPAIRGMVRDRLTKNLLLFPYRNSKRK